MKITKHRLAEIIKEEISQVYADSTNDSPNADVPAN